MEKERAVAMWRLVLSFNVGSDSVGGGAGSPQCSMPPPPTQSRLQQHQIQTKKDTSYTKSSTKDTTKVKWTQTIPKEQKKRRRLSIKRSHRHHCEARHGQWEKADDPQDSLQRSQRSQGNPSDERQTKKNTSPIQKDQPRQQPKKISGKTMSRSRPDHHGSTQNRSGCQVLQDGDLADNQENLP